jgi:mono/diheme cytochrome c family protein
MKTILIISAISLTAFSLCARAADPKTNWANNCAQCHGPDGRANTKMGKQLSAKDLTDPKVQASFSDADATKVIKEGVKQGGKTTMKAFAGKLTDDEIKALVAYVRRLKK